MIVICPEGFWKKGNVDIVCERYKVKQVEKLEEAIELIERERQERDSADWEETKVHLNDTF